MNHNDPRPCCHEETCLREEIANFLDPDSPLADRARYAACKIAETCGKLTTENLKYCFSRMFEAPSECRLCDEFIDAYQLERDALEGRRSVALAQSAGAGPVEP